jgi:hypothetical protein
MSQLEGFDVPYPGYSNFAPFPGIHEYPSLGVVHNDAHLYGDRAVVHGNPNDSRTRDPYITFSFRNDYNKERYRVKPHYTNPARHSMQRLPNGLNLSTGFSNYRSNEGTLDWQYHQTSWWSPFINIWDGLWYAPIDAVRPVGHHLSRGRHHQLNY